MPQPSWRRYLRFWGADVDADVDDELRFHVEMRIRDYLALGLSPDEARRAALARIGDLDRIGGALRAHDHRRAQHRHWRETMTDLVQDLRYAARTLRHAPAFTIVAVLTLALGIGATTAIFSVVNAVILRPLPYPEPERLAMVFMDNRPMGMSTDIHSWPNYADLRDQGSVLSGLAAYYPAGFNLTGGCVEGECEPERVRAAVSTANLFSVLGVAPELGRVFRPDEETQGQDAVVVLSHGVWTRQFGGDPAVIGRTVRLNGREREVIGVMPRGFAFPSAETALWVPLALSADAQQARNGFFLYAIGRLKPGVTVERADAQLEEVMRRLERQYPRLEGFGINVVALPDQVIGPSLRTALYVLLGAVAAVLLIACANVANLMLSRAANREREIAVRLALGATRARLVRQLLTESVLLSLTGGALGVLLAWLGMRALVGLAPSDIPRLDQVRLDVLVLSSTLVIAVLTGLAFGLVPSLQASRPVVADALREGARGTGGARGQRVRRLLVSAQVALVVVLLTGAGLLIRSFLEIQRVQLGFVPDHLLTVRVSLPFQQYQEDAQRVTFYQSLLERLGAVPGIESAAATTDIFLDALPNSGVITVEGRDLTDAERSLEVPFDAVSDDYFRTVGVPMVRGRAFTAADGPDGARVAIVNENMARRFWPGEDAIGKRFTFGRPQDEDSWLTVVGVVGDMRRTGYDRPIRYEAFFPLRQFAPGSMTLVLRTRGAPLALATAVRGEVRALDRDLPVYEIGTVEQQLGAMVAQRRFSMALLGTFAGIALVLGIVGVYGVTSYLVAQRTREVGLRLALGAEPSQVVRMVVRQGMTAVGIGLALGLAAALVGARIMAGLLYGVSPTDVATLALVTVALTVATWAANYLPARRAARVDPLVALRAE